MKKRLPLLAGLLSAWIAHANATVVTYSLQDVTFLDGADATGSFAFDPATDDVTNVGIALSGTSSGTIDFTAGSWDAGQQALDGLQAISFTDSLDSASLTIYVAAFPVSGSQALIVGPNDQYGTATVYCTDSNCTSSSHLVGYPYSTGAAAIETPEPATAAILGTGAVMGLMARRRRTA